MWYAIGWLVSLLVLCLVIIPPFGRFDLPHIAVAIFMAIVGGGIAYLLRRLFSGRRGRNIRTDRTDDSLPVDGSDSRVSREVRETQARLRGNRRVSGESALKELGIGLGRGIAMLIVAVFLSGLSIWDGYYDQGYDQLVRELDVLASAESENAYKIAIGRIDERLKQPISDGRGRELAERKYQYLINLGDVTSDANQKQQYYTAAKEWAEEKGLDKQLAEAKLVGAQPPPPATVTVVVPASPTPRPAQRPLPQGVTARLIGVRRDVGTAAVDFSVTNPDGSPYPRLEAQDVNVLVNGQPVDLQRTNLVSFQQLAQPLYVSIAFDRSGSMRGVPLQRAKDAVGAQLSQLRSQDKVRIVSFDQTVRKLDWMSPQEARNTVNAIEVGGDTALWDAIVEASRDIQQPHVLIVLTDGEDTSSRLSQAAAIQAAQGSIVHAVAIRSPSHDPTRLRQFAQAVDGKVYEEDADDLRRTFESIARETQTLYRLAILTQGIDVTSIVIELQPNTRLSWPR